MKTPSWVTNETTWKELRRGLTVCLNEFIARRSGVIEAARKIKFYEHEFRAKDDPDFTIFVVIDSETDHLPIGAVRQHWSKEALQGKDIEIQRTENLYLAQANVAAHNLLKKYGLPNDTGKHT